MGGALTAQNCMRMSSKLESSILVSSQLDELVEQLIAATNATHPRSAQRVYMAQGLPGGALEGWAALASNTVLRLQLEVMRNAMQAAMRWTCGIKKLRGQRRCPT